MYILAVLSVICLAAKNPINTISQQLWFHRNTLNISEEGVGATERDYQTTLKMKGVIPIAIFLLAMCQFIFALRGLNGAKEEFKRLQAELASPGKKGDVLFLIDTSSNLSSFNLSIVKRFVRAFLSNLTVRLNTTRVELIPFGTSASRFYDGVSNPSLEKHSCDPFDQLFP